ncbi:hypothetical protein Tco_1184927 [Tanacetum coccineum]
MRGRLLNQQRFANFGLGLLIEELHRRVFKDRKSMTQTTRKVLSLIRAKKTRIAFQLIEANAVQCNQILALPEERRFHATAMLQRRVWRPFFVLMQSEKGDFFCITPKANVVADALSRKERELLRVRALVMTIGLDLPKQILKAQSDEARSGENIKKDDVGLVYG